MGRLERDQGALFYEFHLDDAVPGDHLVPIFEDVRTSKRLTAKPLSNQLRSCFLPARMRVARGPFSDAVFIYTWWAFAICPLASGIIPICPSRSIAAARLEAPVAYGCTAR